MSSPGLAAKSKSDVNLPLLPPRRVARRAGGPSERASRRSALEIT